MEGRRAYFIKCPHCNEHTTTKIYEDTTLLKFPLVCSTCHAESIISVVNMKMTIEKTS